MEAGIDTIVISTEWVPVRDTLDIVTAARKKGLTVIGPNTVGVISPGKGILGIMPGTSMARADTSAWCRGAGP